MSMKNKEDAIATIKFELLNVLTKYYGMTLDRNVIEELQRELEHAINNGACSWAFKYKDENHDN